MVANNRNYGYNVNNCPREDRMMNLDFSDEDPGDENVAVVLEKEIVDRSIGGVVSSNENEHNNDANQTIHDNSESQAVCFLGSCYFSFHIFVLIFQEVLLFLLLKLESTMILHGRVK